MPTADSNTITPCSTTAIFDWLFTDGRRIESTSGFLRELGHRINDNGGDVDRLMLSLMTLNPLIVGTADFWFRSTDTTNTVKASHNVRISERYIGSPLQAIYETRKRVRRRLDDLPEDAHRAYTELAEDGYTDYLALPVMFGERTDPGAAIVFCTRRPGGFSDADIESYRRIRDYLAPVLEVHALRHQSRSLMNTYVGPRTSEKVLAGMVKRGDADIINAALWISDLRNFTQVTETCASRDVLQMLNDYFEFIAAAVGAHGGEILRFIGDAMLIVFPIGEGMSCEAACRAALESALDAQSTIATLNFQRRRHGQAQIEFGVGLNIGEVVYGNVGAPDRLDFTVMGPTVNRTARLESLTKELDRDVLFSKEFSEYIDAPTEFLGDFAMKGIDVAQPVYALLPE